MSISQDTLAILRKVRTSDVTDALDSLGMMNTYEMHPRLRPLFPMTERAFRRADPAEARNVIKTHKALRDDLKEYRNRVAASDLTADMAVVYSGAAQILRRVGAHLSNICSTVVQPSHQ